MRAPGPDGREVPAGATVRIQQILTAVKAELKAGRHDARTQAAIAHEDAEATPGWLAQLLEQTAAGVRSELAEMRTTADERVAQIRREADQQVARLHAEAEAENADLRAELAEAVEDLQAASVALEEARQTAAAHEAALLRLQQEHAVAIERLTAERDEIARVAAEVEVDRRLGRDRLQTEAEARRFAEHQAQEHAASAHAARQVAERLRSEVDEARSAQREAHAELRLLRERVASDQALASLVAALGGDEKAPARAPRRRVAPGGPEARPGGAGAPVSATGTRANRGAPMRKGSRSARRRDPAPAPTLAEGDAATVASPAGPAAS
jgi:hypothetical protein